MKKTEGTKNLSLKTETVRSLSAQEMTEIAGGKPWTSCWTIIVPSSGILTTIPITRTDCN